MNVICHYDNLINEGNDPFRDSKLLQDYMNKWDGQYFIDSMGLTYEKTVLEIGVGTGRIISKVAPLVCNCVGIDISPKTIERAKENLIDYHNIQLICADFLTYDFEQMFDIIYSSLTMMHFENKLHVIRKVDKLLKSDGVFCLSIDKNIAEFIDMGSYELRVFPDKIEEIISYIGYTDMHVVKQYETEFAHIVVCSK